MRKISQYLFWQVNGIWSNIDGAASSSLLADFLNDLELYSIPDNTQFLRVCQAERTIEYRAYGGTIRINVITK